MRDWRVGGLRHGRVDEAINPLFAGGTARMRGGRHRNWAIILVFAAVLAAGGFGLLSLGLLLR